MNRPAQEKAIPAAAADRMEAAAWLAKLHGQDRGPELEAGFRRWLAESEDHKAAFDMANEVWADLATIPKSDHPIRVLFKPRRAAKVTYGPVLALAASLAAIATLTAFWWLHEPAVTTEVGQLREVTLVDGTRVILNTDTRIQIRYSKERRHIDLMQGEALFNVAKETLRPFSVAASGQQVLALGTSFVVRRDPGNLAVTLIEGKVEISPVRLASSKSGKAGMASILLAPGQRLTFAGESKPAIDTPPIERLTAWKRKQVSLDHNTLADAVAEMNRYSATQIRIKGNAANNIIITGIFRAGDSEEFARAIADSYGLGLHEADGKLVLSKDF